MERCLAALRVLPGREAELQRRLDAPSDALRIALNASGLSDITIFQRDVDAWLYARAEPERSTALARLSAEPGWAAWLAELRDVVVDTGSDGAGLTWYEEIFHADAPDIPGVFERGLFSLVIDIHRAAEYDDLHARPWPEMIDAIREAGYRDYSGFRRGAHVVYVGRYHPDMLTVLRHIAATDVAARWSGALEGVIVAITDAQGRHFTGQEVFHQD